MALIGLDNADLKLILFGGKGGVGKTSCATATAIELSQKHKTLIISTDPAHSISDCLGQKIRYGVQHYECIDNLCVTEIIAEQAFKDFKKEHEEVLTDLFKTSTNLDSEDIDDLMRLTVPGIDEVMSFKAIIDLIEEGKFSKYVVDTAPTGHLLRLISSPKMLDQWIKMASKMRWKYRYMVTTFSGSYQEDKTDALLIKLKKMVKRIESLLSDGNQCEFIPVCIPESMAILETGRLLSSLMDYKLSVRQMIINDVMESDGCPFCRERKSAQQKYLDQIRITYPQLNQVLVPLLPDEIKGQQKLEQLRKLLFNNKN
ncbi:MAG: ArsA family ATPase [bacterium]